MKKEPFLSFKATEIWLYVTSISISKFMQLFFLSSSYMGKLGDVIQALSGFLQLLVVQSLPQNLLGQMSVQLQPHPALAVLGQELALVSPEVNW